MLRIRFVLLFLIPCLSFRIQVFSLALSLADLPAEPTLETELSSPIIERESMTYAADSHDGSNSAIIISTVDGVIYTLDAYSGNLRGMVQSGGPLVSQPDSQWNENEFEDDYDAQDDLTDEGFEIIPGLDGTLYSYSLSENLRQLPVTIRDIMDHGPISTCTDGEEDELEEEKCGLVMGQVSSKLIALDPLHGTVQWIHQTNTNANFGAKKKGKSKVVLLQREDFNVKHIDAETGTEGWKVHLGSIKALELPKTNKKRTNNNRAVFRIRPSLDIQVEMKKNHKAGSRKNLSGNSEPRFFDQPFPLVAFGDDGLTIYLVDEMRNLLWMRRFESTIASVYGVGGDLNWVDLHVTDFVTDVENHSKYAGLLDSYVDFHGGDSQYLDDMQDMAITHNSQSITNTAHPLTAVPLKTSGVSGKESLPRLPSSNEADDYVCENDDFYAFLGQHLSSLFVATTARKNYLDYYDEEDDDYFGDMDEDDQENGLILRQEDIPFLKEILSKYHAMNMSHKTEHGLFLTWKVVAISLVCILVVVVIGARLVYVRKKRHWMLQSSPNFHPSLSNESKPSSFLLSQQNVVSNTDMIPLLNLERAHTSDSNHLKRENFSLSPVIRSASLPELELHSKGSREENNLFSLGQGRIDNGGKDERSSRSSFAQKQIVTSLTKDAIDAPGKWANSQSMEGVSNIDGIPLVRYSRYRSEFHEISPLGKGGFGTVFKCKNALDGREYAVKKVLIRSHLDSKGHLPAQFSQKLEKVLREVKILALLDHMNIVRYYTAWLEVETEERVGSETPKSHPLVSKAMSSDFLAGSCTYDDLSNSAFFNDSMSPSRKTNSLSPHNKNNVQGNPLGWNTFPLGFDESSLGCESMQKKSYRVLSNGASFSSLKSDDDLGFTFERRSSFKGSSKHFYKHEGSHSYQDNLSTIEDKVIDDDVISSCESESSSADSLSETDTERLNVTKGTRNNTCITDYQENHSNQSVPAYAASSNDVVKYQRHILYIQMQLSQKTLLDYFQTRKGAPDIPISLRMFCHIVRGVQHVHEKGLIHRDLKPSNCFMDDSNVVKIGDFGLSRESGTQYDDVEEVEINATTSGVEISMGQDNTAGVGTSSYASPEQISGSDYDSSSDVYSLGIILFELCYPMHTGMERFKVFEGIRRRCSVFPDKWHSTVANTFPSLHSLLVCMLSHDPKERPTASEVASRIESLLSEYTVHSLDHSSQSDGIIFLRVEAEDSEGALEKTMKIITDSTPTIQIHQYGLRSKGSKNIMEFALSLNRNGESDDNLAMNKPLDDLCRKLEGRDEIKVVRLITD
jgi:Serine/threonine protein kinase